MCLAPAQSSWSSFVPDHTVPYGTALLGGVFPGTSCQATIAPSLRDNSQQALARCCCEMSASASRRDDTDRSLARSAWKSVPRKKEPSRRVRYDQVRRTTRTIEQGAKQIRGFNPGNTVPRRRALQGRQIKRRHNTGQTCTHLSPLQLQGEPFVWMVPRVE